MVDVRRDVCSGFEVFSIKNSTGNLKFFYFYDFDLCWSCDDKEDSDTSSIEFGPEDSYMYTLIDEVYDSISTNQPFKHLKYDFEAKDLVFLEGNDYSKRLFKNGMVEWHSDDCIYRVGSIIYITKENNRYIVTLQKGKTHINRIYPFSDFTVSIANNSRYSPYNITFMNMFNKLREYDFLMNQAEINKYVSKDNVKVRKD
ncbi:MAG: hypothetical protein IJL74_01285 [Bacilli bacterium]|nr:hypothetical protein [Bacilli bacterium]